MSSTRTNLGIALLARLALASCGPMDPQPAIVCHNSNCVEPPNPAQDDSPEALRASLAAAADDGSPILDGMELDLFFRGSDGQCVFAHDLDQENPTRAVDAAAIVADFFTAPRPAGRKVTRSGGPYWVFLELKAQVGKTKTELHTEAQRAAHAQCALDVLSVLASGARAGGVPLRVRFTSFSPDLLRAVGLALKNASFTNDDAVSAGLGAIAGVLPPLDSGTIPIDQFDGDIGVDMVTVHAQWMRDAAYQAYRSRGWEIGFWMFSATPETYDAIELYEPKWVTTNEARTVSRWLSR
jgi:hypothetical protein